MANSLGQADWTPEESITSLPICIMLLLVSITHSPAPICDSQRKDQSQTTVD